MRDYLCLISSKTNSILMFLVVLLGFYFLYLLWEPFTPPSITTPIPILNKDKIIKQGESISTKISYCVYNKAHSTTTRRFHDLDDHRVFFLTTTVSDGTDPKCDTITSNTMPVPTSIPPGRYKVVLDSVFTVNSLRTVSATYETEEFNVKE